MVRLLRFCVEHTVNGRAAELKESVLGGEVFDRGPGYDPRLDPIVRVEMRRLRSKLNAYYERTPGAEFRIEFPTGSYAAHFVPADDRGATITSHAPQAPPASVVVLPFKDLHAAADDEYFSDGLTEELIHVLTKIEGLRVIAWSSANKLRDTGDLRSVARELDAATVLTGSVRRAGDRLRITAHLADAVSGQFLWSETYDRKPEDVFRIQEEIAQAIAASLQVQLLGCAPAATAADPKRIKAHDLYLRGRFQWNKRLPDSLERAISYFSEAIASDPNFAPAYAGLADGYSLRADLGFAHPREVMPQARAAAERAIELDPQLADGYASLGIILGLYDWKWDAAEQAYRRAVSLNPGYVTARHWYGCDYLALLGRFDEALREMQVARDLDPLSYTINESYGYVLLCSRRYDEAVAVYQEARELEPFYYKHFSSLGRAYIQLEKYEEAIGMLQQARAIAGDVPNVLGALGQAFGLLGRKQDARRILSRMSTVAARKYVPSTAFALVHAGLNEPEQAIEWLRKGFNGRELTMPALLVHPAYDALREVPEFTAIVQRIRNG